MSDNSNGYGNDSGDPFAGNPEAEFAPTVATPAITGPPPAHYQGHSAGPQAGPPGYGAPQGMGAQRRQAKPADEKRFGVSSILSLIGGVLIVASFFMPIMSGAYLTIEILAEGNFLPASLLFDEEESIPDDMRAEVEVGRAALEVIEFDTFFRAMEEASGDQDEQDRILEEYGISFFQVMRLFQILDFEGEVLDESEDAKVGSRVGWLTLVWFAFAGLLAVLLAGVRGFRPLNAFQIGWNGVFGLVFLIAALGMLVVDDTKDVGTLELLPFIQEGVLVMAAGAGIMWISAFAGLSTRNWWKAPLFGLLIILVVGGSVAVPTFLVLS